MTFPSSYMVNMVNIIPAQGSMLIFLLLCGSEIYLPEVNLYLSLYKLFYLLAIIK